MESNDFFKEKYYPEFIKSPEALIRSVIYRSGYIRNYMNRFGIYDDELVQEGRIAIWQAVSKLNKNPRVASAENSEAYFMVALKGEIKRAILNYIKFTYRRNPETPVSTWMTDEDDSDSENNFISELELKHSAFPKKAEVFSRIEVAMRERLETLVAAKDKGKIAGWMRVLELIARGYSMSEIEQMEGKPSGCIQRVKKIIIKYLGEVFQGVSLRKLFAQPKSRRAGKTVLLFGAINSGVTRKGKAKTLKKVEKIFANFNNMSIKEICEKYGVHRTTAWRAKKQGFLEVGRSRERWQYQYQYSDEMDNRPIVEEFFMPERNKPFWANIRLAVSGEEWIKLWEWAHGYHSQIDESLLEKARRTAFGGQEILVVA